MAPVLAASRAKPDRSVDRVIAERGWVDVGELERLTGERRDPIIGQWVVAPELLASAVDEVRARVESAGPLGLELAALDDRQRAVLATLEGIAVEGGRARTPDAADPLAGHPYLEALEAAPFAPPPPDGVDRAELRELVRRGLVVERDGVWFSPAAVDRAAQVVAERLTAQPGGVTVSEIRDALGTTRKYLLPLLAQLDATGVTRRRGDLRIAGPRLPTP